jgi:hypothetical protein
MFVIVNNLHTEFVGKFIVYNDTKFRTRNSTGS